jgi:hypothetical protein
MKYLITLAILFVVVTTGLGGLLAHLILAP